MVPVAWLEAPAAADPDEAVPVVADGKEEVVFVAIEFEVDPVIEARRPRMTWSVDCQSTGIPFINI